MSDAGVTLRRVVEALDASGAEHMVVGSFASAFHGEPRTTRDIDIVVEAGPEELDRFVSSLPASRWYADADAAREALEHRSMFNVIDLETGWKVDLIFLKRGAFAKSEFSRRFATELLGVRAFVASAEDTILSKLLWARESGSERQLRDVAGIVDSCGDALDRAYVDRWAEELDLTILWRRISNEA